MIQCGFTDYLAEPSDCMVGSRTGENGLSVGDWARWTIFYRQMDSTFALALNGVFGVACLMR